MDDVSLAAPAAAGSETAGAPAGERALAGLAAAAATTPQVQPRAQQRTAASVASPEVAKRAASDARVATPGHPAVSSRQAATSDHSAVSDWQVATPGHPAVSDRQVATPTHPGAPDGAAAAPGKPAAAALETVQAPPVQAPPAQAPSPVPQHPALAAPTAHARAAALPSTAAALVDVAVSARATRARIVLTPPELGTVEIRLRYGERGVSATFHADSSQAAQTLALAAGDLRRALEAQGIQVQQIDVPAARTDQQTPAWSGGGDGAWNAGRGHGSAGDAPASGGDPTTLEPDDPITHRAVLLGTAVDVLA
ncbi:MAG: flagellar hook-length control protein FliK [Thermoleophilia bacterium]|nr:flagellar hook-length control protein FliK [Thermoleophilia bacterium]